MSAGLAASTVAPGRTAPDTSFTTPVMDDWASAEAGRRATHVSTVATRTRLRIPHLLSLVAPGWRRVYHRAPLGNGFFIRFAKTRSRSLESRRPRKFQCLAR